VSVAQASTVRMFSPWIEAHPQQQAFAVHAEHGLVDQVDIG
jgi:hypothetical protein